MHRRFLKIVIVLGLVSVVGFPVTALAYGKGDWRTRRAVVAPGVRLVTPPYRVAVVCRACGGTPSSLPDFVVRLGARLNRAGFDPVPMSTPPSPEKQSQYAVILAEAGLGSSDAIRFSSPLDDRAVGDLVAEVERRVAPDAGPTRPLRYLFAVRSDTGTGRMLLAQSSWVVHYAKLDADFISVEDLVRAPTRWLERYASVVLATDSLPNPGRLAGLLDGYVRAGGGLAALARIEDPALRPLFGIARVSDREERVEEVVCEPTWLPGAGGVSFRYGADWAMMIPEIGVAKDGRVLCRARTDAGREVPSVISKAHGAGRTLMWLSGEIGDKPARGRILLSILEVSQPAVAAMMDALVFWVDDCPMPMWGKAIAPVDRLYGMTDAEFYTRKWWPDLSALFERHDVRPSFGFVLSYDARVVPPFTSGFEVEKEDREGDKGEVQTAVSAVEAATALARAIQTAGHEIALHGYNHQSLTVAKSELSAGWAGLEVMVEALTLARQEMIRLFGPDALPVTYVAPNNLVHALGKQAVHRVFPEIRAIASQYLDEDSILGQEFGPDPDIPGLVDIPRISSENFLDSDNAAEVLDALVVPGVLSHFIHPDDIFDPARSRGKDWEGLLAELDRLLAHVRQTYPFLRAMTAAQFADVVRAWPEARLEATRSPNSLVLRAPGAPGGFLTTFVRLPAGVRPTTTGCEVLLWATREGRFHVRVGEGPCMIRWE